jgi:hypothetical protein
MADLQWVEEKRLGTPPWALKRGDKTLLWRDKPEDIGGDVIYKLGTSGKTAQESSENFRALGIPGIRYLDAGSRIGPQNPIANGYYANKPKTANYVVFDDALIEILKRNGVPIK